MDSKPVDGGHLILDAAEKQTLLSDHPEAKPFVRPLLGSEELINGGDRWCIWLAGASPSEWRSIRGIHERVEQVRDFRLKSKKAKTVEQADEAAVFGELRQPASNYLAAARGIFRKPPLHPDRLR